MAHLSATEMINELNTTNMTQFEMSNGLLYAQPKSNEKRLSPWFGKRRYSKSIKVEKKLDEEDKFAQSDKTEQFLKKIFPRKRPKVPDQKTTSIYQQKPQILKVTVGLRHQQQNQEEESVIFLPIKPINFQKIKTTKLSHTERKSQADRKLANKVQPQVFEPPRLPNSHLINQSPKSSSLAFTFRKNWRKKDRVKTEPVENTSKKKRMSIEQIYNLIGRDVATKTYRNDYLISTENFQATSKQNTATNPWLMPRSMKKNHKSSKFRAFVCKTQYI